MATGAWLLFLGADDTLYETDTLASVSAFIGDHDSGDVVYGDVINRSTGTRRAGVFDLDRLLFETNMCHQSIFYRRELFAGIGPYNLRYRVWADWDFNIRCFSNPALVARYMDIVVARYNDMSGVSTRVDKEFKKRLPIFFWASALEMFRRTLLLLTRREYLGDQEHPSANIVHEIRLAGFLRIALPLRRPPPRGRLDETT